jgi:hypothetical protein
MYVTADGDEVIHERYPMPVQHKGDGVPSEAGSVKVRSTDVDKVNTIYTDDTPDGRYKLVDYFKKIENEIAAEVAGRTADIAAIRTQMAKNKAYNAKARAAMKKTILARMAVNAKAAKDALDEAMRQTAIHFHKNAVLENKRHKMDIKRFKKTRAIMRANKAEAKHNLHMATLSQQRALATLDQATNAKIHSTNEHIAANAAHIAENAATARKALETAMGRFDTQMYNAKAEAKAGRAKLSEVAMDMDKKFRAMVANKVKSATSEAAEEFQKIRKTMEEDRHNADMALTAAVTRIDGALAARAAIQDKRFASTVADIAAARKEADERVKKASAGFKMNILNLKAVATEQTAKLANRQSQLDGTVKSNQLEQAKVNNNVNAELKRLQKLGSDRQAALAKADTELGEVMSANRDANQKQMQQMGNEFNAALEKIKGQMKKDRAYNEQRLAKQTQGLYATLKSNKEAQDKVNAELTAATRRAGLDAKEALKEARADFTTRLGALTTTVEKNQKDADKKIAHLTGIEEANAAHSLEARRLLKMQSESNKKDVTGAIRDAIAKGEKHAQAIESRMADVNKKSADALNLRITTEIGTLTKQIHGDIEELRFATKEARAQMKEEIVGALRSEQKILKDSLATTVKWASKKMSELEDKLASEEATNSAGRAALKAEIAAEKEHATNAITDAMSAQTRAILALKEETEKEIKKTNTDVAAYGKAVEKHAEETAAVMAANAATIEEKLDAASKAIKSQQSAANAASVARHAAAIDAVKTGVKAAKDAADVKFGEVYKKMGQDRAHADEQLGAATAKINEALAAQAALEDSRFATTVKDLNAAKQEARDAVVAAKKEFTMGFADVVSHVKGSESRIMGEIQVVSAMVVEDRAVNARSNAHMKAELERVVRLSDNNYSDNKRARGQIGELMNKNKQTAAEETAALSKASLAEIQKVREEQTKLMDDAKEDLDKATTKLYEHMAADEAKQQEAMGVLNSGLNMAQASSAQQLKAAKEEFAIKHQLLTNTVTANHKKYEEGLEKVTGVHHDWEKASKEDRALIREEAKAMEADLNADIQAAIQKGEARAKEVLDRSTRDIDAWKEATTIQIGERVERMADAVFQTVNTNRGVIANNYLSVKGYAGSASDDIIDYIQKGQGKALLSVGDFLQSVALVSTVKTKPAEGVSAGKGDMEPTFGGKIVPDVKEINDVNGLANEFMEVYTGVRQRWPAGLGKYLLIKLADSMAKGGILSVGKKSGAEGQWIMVSGKALGLANKLEDFEALGARINHYQDFLTKLSAKLPKVKAQQGKALSVTPPEWQGN